MVTVQPPFNPLLIYIVFMRSWPVDLLVLDGKRLFMLSIHKYYDFSSIGGNKNKQRMGKSSTQ